MKQSINYEMLRVGHDTPTYQEDIFYDLRYTGLSWETLNKAP